jgi:type I restriction enzyme, S subunit
MESNLTLIRTIPFSEFDLWDVKRYVKSALTSKYPIVKLEKHISERSEKVKLFAFPKQEFGILGVNNKEGVFDAYTEKGENINQSYKKVKNDDLTYNPYRINVGSIGRKTAKHKNNYISPAYIVFECKNGLNSEFLYRMFKTEEFNKIINDNTTGSVRQNLKFSTLTNIKIPLLPVNEQNRIIEQYNQKVVFAKRQAEKAESLERSLSKLINSSIGITIKENSTKSDIEYFSLVNFQDLEKWGVEAQNNTKIKYTKGYSVTKISKVCTISSGGTPSRNRQEYFQGDIPWIKTGEVLNDIIYDTEEKITKEAIKNSSAKLYEKGSLIIAMYGQGKTRGRTAKLGINASTNQACAVLFDIDNKIVLTDYLWAYLLNEYDRLRELASGNNQPNLNAQMIKDYPVVIPPIYIQQKIIEDVIKLKKEIKDLRDKSGQTLSNAVKEFEQEIFN